MNAHDWTRVDDGTFHGFHQSWIAYLKSAIKRLLPTGFYVDSEQHMGRKTSDILGLHRSPASDDWPPALTDRGGALSVAEARPHVALRRSLSPVPKASQRTLAIRHTRGHRIVALIEVVSPGNKNSERGVLEFIDKACQAIRAGVHLAVLDLLPPTSQAPDGLIGAVEKELTNEWSDLPEGKPLAFTSYQADVPPQVYNQPFAVGEAVPGLPLFLTPEYYLELPLADTYEKAFDDAPPFAQELLTAGG